MLRIAIFIVAASSWIVAARESNREKYIYWKHNRKIDQAGIFFLSVCISFFLIDLMVELTIVIKIANSENRIKSFIQCMVKLQTCTYEIQNVLLQRSLRCLAIFCSIPITGLLWPFLLLFIPNQFDLFLLRFDWIS